MARYGTWGWKPTEINRILLSLADPKQRYLLYYFYTNSKEIETADALQAYLCANFDQKPKALALDLYHSLFPRLEESNVIDFDRRSGTVRYYPDEMLEQVLDLCILVEYLPEKWDEPDG